MKKTWKKWIAIACAFTMIAGILPAAVLADEEAATPTNLAAASEEIQEEPGEEIPGEEPAEEGQEEAPGDEPGEEPDEVGQTEEPAGDEGEGTPAGEGEGEEPAGDEQGEEPAGDGQGKEQTEDEQGEESAEEENDPQNDLPRLSFGKPGYNGALKAGEEFRIAFVSDLSRNFLVTLTLLPGADQIPDTAGVRMTYDGISQELARIENEDPENTEIRLQFGAYAAQDTEYVITVTAPFDTEFILTADSKPAEPAQEDDDRAKDGEENKEDDNTEESVDGKEAAEEKSIIAAPDETVVIRLWVSGLEDDAKPGDSVTLRADSEIEITGIPTWYVRNALVENGEWKKAGYGDHLTVVITEGDEYRFVMQDGAISEVVQLSIPNEKAEDPEYESEVKEAEKQNDEDNIEETIAEPVLESEPAEKTEKNAEEESTIMTAEEPDIIKENRDDSEEKTEDEPEKIEHPEGTEEVPLDDEMEIHDIPERHITVEVTWDVPDPVIGDTAHFTAILEGYEGIEYTMQWQYSPDGEEWFDIPDETGITLDMVITEENNTVYWRILVLSEDITEIET